MSVKRDILVRVLKGDKVTLDEADAQVDMMGEARKEDRIATDVDVWPQSSSMDRLWLPEEVYGSRAVGYWGGLVGYP